MTSASSRASTENLLAASKDAITSPLGQEASTVENLWDKSKSTLPPRLAIGAASGLAATSAMTAAMLGMQQKLPFFEQYPLPPRQIVDHIARWLGIRKDLTKQNLNVLTGVAHFGYGAIVGSVYGPLGLALPVPGIVSGVVWGLLVWAGSYLGLLPGLNILQSAARQPRDRVLLMVLAHVVWGVNLGILTDQIAMRFGKG